MNAEQFIAALVERLSALLVAERVLEAAVDPTWGPKGRGTSTVVINFFNVPPSHRHNRVECENNRMLFFVRGFHDEPYAAEPALRVVIKQGVNTISEKNLRKKTATPDAVATYLTFLNQHRL